MIGQPHAKNSRPHSVCLYPSTWTSPRLVLRWLRLAGAPLNLLSMPASAAAVAKTAHVHTNLRMIFHYLSGQLSMACPPKFVVTMLPSMCRLQRGLRIWGRCARQIPNTAQMQRDRVRAYGKVEARSERANMNRIVSHKRSHRYYYTDMLRCTFCQFGRPLPLHCRNKKKKAHRHTEFAQTSANISNNVFVMEKLQRPHPITSHNEDHEIWDNCIRSRATSISFVHAFEHIIKYCRVKCTCARNVPSFFSMFCFVSLDSPIIAIFFFRIYSNIS